LPVTEVEATENLREDEVALSGTQEGRAMAHTGFLACPCTQHTRRFAADPHSIGEARRFVAESLTGIDPDTLHSATLMVSELATNSIKHARSGFALTVVKAGDEIRIEVSDRGPGTPALRAPGEEAAGGCGLRLISTLCGAWGVEFEQVPAKTVWFTVRELAAEEPGIRLAA
jgi:anti-sigma regulatory factor (Ser/Thr protein kinase)